MTKNYFKVIFIVTKTGYHSAKKFSLSRNLDRELKTGSLSIKKEVFLPDF